MKKIITNLKNNFKTHILIGFACIAIVVGFIYWQHSARYISTDDAYVNANIVEVSSRISGQITHNYVENNQLVKQNQLLFEIDAAPFKLAVDKARAQLSITESDLHNAQVTAERITTLADLKFAAKQTKDDVLAKLQSATASVALAKAALAQAELDLSYTKVYAATTGLVANMTLRDGNVVTINQPLFALISVDQYWVDANFKETELKNIKLKLATDVEVDMYPNHHFHGVVESISGGSGTAFSLLPPQNAAGNWVKVTQRVPVKIRILNPDPRYPLRIGTTATVTIDTKRMN